MSYIDSFVVPIRKSRLEDYRRMAQLSCEVWMEHGALEFQEFVADDVQVGEVTSFPRSVQLADDEIVGVSYIRYASREHRDTVMKQVMEDERMKSIMGSPDEWPFNGQRMIWGGFKLLVGSERH